MPTTPTPRTAADTPAPSAVVDAVKATARLNMELETLRARNAALVASLRKMLEVYWGNGDGGPDPDFIAEAKRITRAGDVS